MTSFVENKELVAMTIILLLLSILCKFITGIFLNTLIREAENMSSTVRLNSVTVTSSMTEFPTYRFLWTSF